MTSKRPLPEGSGRKLFYVFAEMIALSKRFFCGSIIRTANAVFSFLFTVISTVKIDEETNLLSKFVSKLKTIN